MAGRDTNPRTIWCPSNRLHMDSRLARFLVPELELEIIRGRIHDPSRECRLCLGVLHNLPNFTDMRRQLLTELWLTKERHGSETEGG
eukprot:CAMPEP_0115733262 /NCGR_PEP_ID=MMETSP0272-20121206/85564_1 /TAXON_ID=71861 /ORGANISM="Scrippsiella trochoidea, Strain CCMP3099" /LENGTH=86 /DNA_ID=CAMNT_0003177233 /DNA_START=250 /DNA_END=510 /DNA_ORIENTATION=-